MKLRPNGLAWIIFVLLLCGYVLTYVTLSLNGSYQPGAYGGNGVKWYSWAPAGFLSEDGVHWSKPMMWTFAPLYIMDIKCWHKDQY